MRTNLVRGKTLGGRARQAQLVDCAVQALCEVGYAHTSIAEVARRAGVSKGVVTYHFPTKQALLQQVVFSLYERAGSRIAERVDASESALDALVGYVEANLSFVAEHTGHVRAVMEVAANVRPSADASAARRADADPVSTHLRTLIERGVTSGEMPDVDAGALALVVRSAIDAAAAQGATDPCFDHEHYARQLVLLVVRALEVRL